MGLVNDHGKSLAFQLPHQLLNIQEFVDGGHNDFDIAVEGVRQVFGGACLIHDLDEAGFVLQRQHRVLKLAVHHNSVGDDADRIKNDSVLPVVKGGQTVRQPRDGVGFPAARRVLDEIIFLAVVLYHVRSQLAHNMKLMIAGENQPFPGHAPSGSGVPSGLLLQENHFINQIQKGVFFENILPHIGDIDAVFVVGVPLAGVDSHSAALVEGQEEGGLPLQVGTQVDLVQIHGKVGQAPRLELQQAGLAVPLILVLADGVLTALSAGVAFQLKGEDSNAVEKNHKVYALPLFVPDFLHHREDVLLIQGLRLPVEGGGRLSVHQAQGDAVVKLHAVLQHIQQAPVLSIDLVVDVVEDRPAGLFAVELLQPGQGVLLGPLQKGEQQLHIHAAAGIIRHGRAHPIAVLLPQHFQNVCLIICPLP